MNITALQGDGMGGLSGGKVIWRSALMASNQSGFVNFDADLILPPQTNIAVFANSISDFTSIGFFVSWVDQGGGV
jgi:hypothetical protein